MKALEIPNLPDEMYQEFEKLARVRGTTVADVALSFIRKGVAHDDAAEAALMAEIRAERDQMAREGVWITDADIRAARDWGRE